MKKPVVLLLISLLCCGFFACKGGEKQEAQLVSISVAPAQVSVAKDTIQQFTATGIYSDDTTKDLTASVTWSSSDATVAVFGTDAVAGNVSLSKPGSPGHAYAKAPGTTTIKAVSGTFSGSAALTVTPATLVSIGITPTNPSIAKGTTRQFTAAGTFSDNSSQDITATVSWSSATAPIATINQAGLAESGAAGTTLITAARGSISASTTLTVTPALLASISVTPADPAIGKGTTRQFTAMGSYSDGTTQDVTDAVTWSSSETSVATVDAGGLATAAAPGRSTITAVLGTVSASAQLTVNPAALVSIAVTPANASIAKGTTQQFTAAGIFSDGTSQDLTGSAVWSSSNPAAATVSTAAGSKGLATGVAAGSAAITAASGSVTGSAGLTVKPAVLVSIDVTPASAFVGKGGNQQFTATGSYSDGSTQDLTTLVTWSSSGTAIAEISNGAGSNGQATGVAAGTTTIKAVSGSLSGSAALSVVDATAELAWDAPATNTDGSPLADLAGYRIRCGTSPGNYTTTINAGNVTSYTVKNLSPGTWYFTVTAVNSEGTESGYSNEAVKTIQ